MTEASIDGPLALKVERVQELLACSRSQVYALAQAGHLKTVRLGTKRGSGLRICAVSVRDFVAAGGCQPGPRPAAATPSSKTAMGAASEWRRQARARLDTE
ncbi:MAG: helix-turn-helix domain-containing protein [Solirubrobacterales bacterium]